jgi:hypothetical protein
MDNERSKRLPYLLQAKKRFLADLNPLNLIWMAANDLDYQVKLKL